MRTQWIDLLERIALPVMQPLSAGKLRATMPVDNIDPSRASFVPLEAFGRTMAGIAPWLCAPDLSAQEGARRDALLALTVKALAQAADPTGPDRMDFLDSDKGAQPIVDTAFLALGLLRCFDTIWPLLGAATKENLCTAMEHTRTGKPSFSNWLLFSACTEAFLHRAGRPCDLMRIDYALRQHEAWYVGDGHYSDGPNFHADYYNSYVIHPMLLAILEQMHAVDPTWAAMWEAEQKRAGRYAAVLEKYIAADGSFPVVGRSICYRMGAFHALADAALRGLLPDGTAPAAVRGALWAATQRCTAPPDTFGPEGFLQVGLCGHQPALREGYINTGSLYLCATAFLALGLAPSAAFWSAPDADWTQKRAWAGHDLPADHAL